MSYPKNANPNFKWGYDGKVLSDPSLFGPFASMVNYADIDSQIDSGGNTPLTQGPTRGIFVDQAGTVTGHDAYGNVVTAIPVQAGYNPICLGGITSIATVTKIWGVW